MKRNSQTTTKRTTTLTHSLSLDVSIIRSRKPDVLLLRPIGSAEGVIDLANHETLAARLVAAMNIGSSDNDGDCLLGRPPDPLFTFLEDDRT